MAFRYRLWHSSFMEYVQNNLDHISSQKNAWLILNGLEKATNKIDINSGKLHENQNN